MNKNILKLTPLLLVGLNLYALDINEAVQTALLDNNSLKQQQYVYDEAKENINISKSSYKPKFDLSYTYNANSENISSAGKDNSNASAVLSYNLFNGLKDKYNLKSSKQLADMSKYNYLAAKYDLIYSVKQNYISYLKSLKNIDTKYNAFNLLEQQYTDSENRFAQGLLARNDLLQVNAQMLQSKQDLARAKSDSKISRYQLKNTLGGSLLEDEKIVDLEKQIIQLSDYNPEELNNRSEIKALKMTIESLSSQKSANKGNYLPSADLNLSYTKFGDDAFLDTDDSSVDDQQTASINLKWNLFNGGADSSQDIIYKKRLMQTQEALEDLKLSIKLQHEKAIEEFDVSQLNFETAKVSLEQSNENYKIVNNRFKEGLSSSTDLINANFLLSSAKQSFDNAYYDRFLAKASLDRIFEK